MRRNLATRVALHHVNRVMGPWLLAATMSIKVVLALGQIEISGELVACLTG